MTTNNANSRKIPLKPPALLVSSESGSRSRRCLLIDEAGAAEARRRPAGDGHAGRAPVRRRARPYLVKVPDQLERFKATSFYLDETLLNSVFEPWLKS